MDISPYIVAALVAGTVVLIGRWFDERRFRTQQKAAAALQPSQIQASEAETRHANAETVDSQNRTIANQNGTIAQMVGQIGDQNTKIFRLQNTSADQLLEIGRLHLKSDAQDVVIKTQNDKLAAQDDHLSRQTEEIARLKAENADLKQKIEDYPDRVIQLEGIITELKEEIRKLRDEASLTLHTQAQQAENVKTALNTLTPDAQVPVPVAKEEGKP